MSYQVIVIPADDSAIHVKTIGADGYSLANLQQCVGGIIGSAPAPDTTVVMYCNDEGKLDGLAINPRATEFWASFFNTTAAGLSDALCGPVVLASYHSEQDDENDSGDACSQLDPKWLAHFGLAG